MSDLVPWIRITVYWLGDADPAEWCTSQFGDTDMHSAVWTYDWGYESNSAIFYFKNEEDAMLFALRWK